MSTNEETGVLQTSKEGQRLAHWAVDRDYLCGDPDYFLGKYVEIEKEEKWTVRYKIDLENVWHGIFVAYLADMNNLPLDEFILPSDATFQCDLCFPQTHHRISILNCIRDGDLIRTNIVLPK